MSKHGLEKSHQNSVQNLQPEESTESGRGAGSYPISRTDLLTHTASPVSCTPFTQPLHQDTDVPQHSLNEKCKQIEPARWWARHHPFGEGYGHTDTTLELVREGHDTRHAQGDIGMTLSSIPSQAFVQDPEGKTHVLLYHPQDSIAKNLLRHSSQLHLPPLMELYILSGSHIIQADRTGTENGLHHEPHLKILLRCRGGM